jgi:hypothetical protein
MWKDGDLSKKNATAHISFSEKDWGIDGPHKVWIKCIKKEIDKLGRKNWVDILEAADAIRERVYR